MVDSYSGWPEAYPPGKEDAEAVVKALINHFIPSHGFPKRIRFDNGSHFKHKHLGKVETALNIELNIKTKMAKVMATTGLNWVDALPLVLSSVRYSINRSTGFSPFELHHGRPFPPPWGVMGPISDCNTKVMFKLANHLVSTLSIDAGHLKSRPRRRTVLATQGFQNESGRNPAGQVHFK